jgi:hypothetical protein
LLVCSFVVVLLVVCLLCGAAAEGAALHAGAGRRVKSCLCRGGRTTRRAFFCKRQRSRPQTHCHQRNDVYKRLTALSNATALPAVRPAVAG